MKETILKIEEIHEGHGLSGKSGYAIITDKQIIKLLIYSGQYCCEN